MLLRKFIFVNWGNIPHTEFELGPVNLLSGGNGSGKTTAADAIQTILTAAHDNLFSYNPGQDESTQRSRGKQVRTLASYVLGCDDGSYARPEGAIGYLAAVFDTTQGESGERFTAVIGSQAHVDRSGSQPVARLDEQMFLIVPGEALSLGDFVKEYPDGRHVVPLAQCHKLLATRLGARQIEKFDTKRGYLCRLYGALRGKRTAVSEREAMHAARAFSRFMAYKPVNSIHEFVAQDILEKRDQGEVIRNVSALLKTIHGMEQEARSLRESLQRLDGANRAAQIYIDGWQDCTTRAYISARSQWLAEQQRYLDAKQRQQQLRGELEANAREREALDARDTQLEAAWIELAARRQGIPALAGKDQLEQQRALLSRQLAEHGAALAHAEHRRSGNQRAAQALLAAIRQGALGPQRSSTSLLAPLQQVQDSETLAIGDLQSFLVKDFVDDSPLEAHLPDALAIERAHDQLLQWLIGSPEQPGWRDTLAQNAREAQQEQQALERRLRDKQQEIEQISQQRASYPAGVRAALEAIRRELPEAEPAVLCDFVEVSNHHWQSAIEGYIGQARFSILVRPEWEAEAIRLVRRLPPQQRARVIQGSQAQRDAERVNLARDSIVQLMRFHHPVAEAFIAASYGSVSQVDNADELRHSRRGLTADGMGSANYAMFRCDLPDGELVFGQGARQRARDAKLHEVEQLQQTLGAAAERQRQAQALADSARQIEPPGYARAVEQLLQCQRQLRAVENSLERLDLSDGQAMEDEIEQTRQQRDALGRQRSALDRSGGALQEQLKRADADVARLAEAQEQRLEEQDRCEEALKALALSWPEFKVDERLQWADREAAVTSPALAEAHAITAQDALKSQLYDLSRSLDEHNRQCRAGDSIACLLDLKRRPDAALFAEVCQLQQDIERVASRLRHNVLATREQDLARLRQQFDHTFISDFCHSIQRLVHEGKSRLEELNRELEHHRFGTDRERYRFTWDWLPEFREYWQFFEALNALGNQSEGASLFEQGLPASALQTRDRLLEMLLSGDEQHAMRELERISDYRNYRRYDILKEVDGKEPISLSQYGTGSGGQLETPFYIIRAAAITSAFRFNEGDTHLRMVLVDEAFSKMDEARSREVLGYLTRTQGLQVCFVMPSSKAGVFFDAISHEFLFVKAPLPPSERNGELRTRVYVDRKVCKQEKIQALWADHRRTIRHQHGFDFLDEVNDTPTAQGQNPQATLAET